MKKSIFLAICLLAFQMVDAQINDFKWRFGVNAGFTQYHGDLNSDIDVEGLEGWRDFRKDNKDFLKDQKRMMFGIELERRISQRIGLRLGANIGQVAHSDRFVENNQFARSLNFQTDIVDANAALKLSLFKRKSFFNLYLLGGVGFTYFDVYGDLQDENGNFYNYASSNVELDEDYETNLSDLDLQRDYDQFIMHIPVGVGARLKILPRVTASLEIESRFLFSDYLDNVSDIGAGRTLTEPTDLVAYNPNPAYENELRGNRDDKLYDSYHVVRVGLSYSFGKMKNASSSRATSSRAKSFKSRVNNAGSKIKNAVPRRKGKFRAPVFYPSSTPSSLHTEADAQVDGGQAMEVAAQAAAEAEAMAAVGIDAANTEGVSEETMILIDETLRVVDETILVIDETVAEQDAIELEILELEKQILSLEEELSGNEAASDDEKNQLIEEIERLEIEVDQAIEEQEAYQLEMEKAQLEALEMLEAANREIELAQEQAAASAEALEVKAEQAEAIEDEVEEREEKVKEKASKKKKRKNKKKKEKNEDKEIEIEVVEPASSEEVSEEIEVEIKVDAKDNEDIQIWVEEDGNGEYKIEKKVIIIEDEDGVRMHEGKGGKHRGMHGGKGNGMMKEMHEMQMEIDKLQAEKNEMQMDQIQRELDDIKNTLNLLIKQRIDEAENGNFDSSWKGNIEGAKACDPADCKKKGCDPANCKPEDCSKKKDCCKEGSKTCDPADCNKKDCCKKDGKACSADCKKDCCKGGEKSSAPASDDNGTGSNFDAEEMKKLMQENEQLNSELKQALNDLEKKSSVNTTNSYPTTGSTNTGTSGSSVSTPTRTETTTTTTETTSTPTYSGNTGTTSTYSFPKSSTGRTKYDYTQMEQINAYDVSYTANSFNANDPQIRQLLQSVASEVSSIGGVVLIKANTTEYEKTKMSNVVFDINKEFVYNYNLSPQQIDSSIHIAADGVNNVRELYINNNKVELLIFR